MNKCQLEDRLQFVGRFVDRTGMSDYVRQFGLKVGDRWEAAGGGLDDGLSVDVILLETCTYARQRYWLGAFCCRTRRYAVDMPAVWFDFRGLVADECGDDKWQLARLVWRRGTWR